MCIGFALGGFCLLLWWCEFACLHVLGYGVVCVVIGLFAWLLFGDLIVLL